MDDEGPSGLILDGELPLTGLARSLRMAEAEVCQRMADLVARLGWTPDGGPSRV